MKKRIVALLLCCVMLLTLSPSLIATATAEDETTHAQTEVMVSPAKADLPRNKKVTLTAQAKDAESYQWQIMAEDDLWVDISGETESTIQVSYAMVASLLDGGKAQLRCKTDLGTTDPATVTVTEAQAVAAAPAKAAPKAGTVVKEAEAIGSAVVQDGEGDVVNDETVTPGETTGDERDTYTIVINYVFEDGKQAANPWTATVAKGSSYAQVVTSPTVLGYAPNQETVSVSVVNAQMDTTYTVTYSAAKVDFTVKHYQQNLNDDLYTLKDTESKENFTDSPVGDKLAKSYEGFTALLYDTTTKIAADGSTVVEIYYDRNYFLMSFDLDGGYGVEPIYARYGSKIEVDTPTKAGYTFAGWQKVKDGADPVDAELPTTMPAENSKYKAKWTAKDLAKVTIVVWGENADDENYSYIKNGAVMATPDEKLELDDLQGKRICGLEEHRHTSDCGVNCKHVHDLTCYGLPENAQPVTPSAEALKYFAKLSGGIQDGYIYYFDDNGTNGTGNQYYLRLNGQYYHYDNNPNTNKGSQVGSRVSCDEGTWHATDYFYKYNLKVTCTHSHDDSCYTCGKVAHTHTSDCYYNSNNFMDSKLWNLVCSDTVTVAADGTSVMNVYYDRVEFTLHFRQAYSNSDDYGTIQAKWGANIREAFKAKCTSAGTSNWSRDRDASDPWTSYLDIMPAENRIYYANTVGTGTSTAYYYVEGLDGKDQLFYENKSTGTGYTVTVEEFIEIDGFTFNAERSAKVKDKFNGAKFYYTRNSYTLEFYNYNAVVDGAGGSVKYQAPLKNYYFPPDYPSDLEPNAYVFDGWYTTAGCYEGSKADLNTMTMPAANLMLYAKWTPKTHTVNIYRTSAMTADQKIGDTQTVAHGKQAVEPAKPTNGNYTFVGWFYKDNGVEKAFDFSMPVNKDLDLYAKWSSNSLVEYTIQYELEDGTVIAPPTTGSALANSTRTFEAKIGTQLNKEYQTGYFPKTGSHSITMDIEGKNEFTFIYVPQAKVNYTVRYLVAGAAKDTTNQAEILLADKHDVTSDAVITEKFVAIPGYAPDAYQKRLVLGIDEDENVIIFWYVQDTEHAPVQVIHWIQNIAGDGYTEYQSSTDLNAELKKKQTSTALTISGFTYKKGSAVAGTTTTNFTAPDTPEAVLTADGLVLNLYYNRIEYPYEFRFLEQGTDKVLADPVKGNARYQAQVTQTAETIPGYTLVSAENQAINIAIEDPADAANKNVRTFYYTEQEVTINYQVVGPKDCGKVDLDSETVKVITGEPKGSTPTANPGFKFVGWYLDENCVMAVDGKIPNAVDSTTNKLTPQKRQGGFHYEWTYYAKFEYDITDLTITKTYAAGEPLDKNQSAVFTVTDNAGFSIDVVIHGRDSVTIKGLKVGTTYTVTEKIGWTWRYTTAPTSQKDRSIQLAADAKQNKVEFTNTLNNNKWLTGGAWCDNVWGSSTPKKSTSNDYSGK